MATTEKRATANIELGQRLMIRSPMDDIISIRVMKTDAEKCTFRMEHPDDYTLTIDESEAADAQD